MTEAAPESSAPAGTDYQTTIHLNAPPEVVFAALTTLDGLAAWWVPVSGSGEAGGDLRFRMSAADPLLVHVDEATPPGTVRWTVTECKFMRDWVGTRPSFTISALEAGGSELHFRHYGLTSDLDCSGVCTPSWNHFVGRSLRDYVESGQGHPFGSPADKAWRAELASSGS